ncbi:hypothetical protein BKA82DRAFT_324886 [Pisolithus tinctorius]|uniref:Uncharacterized protein n=1 Tax=Pisolithus tinctorius Marx 270 TaxID=870435 RepID=A0A0C3P646_PISTI|nr:hypothetical protein BKA82DRAFT_324886 [Pisolithus tinctorius]KIO08730.1 hypothetical protein M404DRAFT_324886 [Pisolithus tinctorius Marx 270]
MDTPSIWSEIWLENYITSTLLKLHLERSRQAPLTIFLRVYDPELLDVVAAHPNRWHALWILCDTLEFLDRICYLGLPSLELLVLSLERDCAKSLPMIYSRLSALKHLQLRRLSASFSASSMTANLLGNSAPHSAFLGNIPAESLTKLSLWGTTYGSKFPRDSIHFPVLEYLILRIIDPMSFLEAVVAPRLERFEFSEQYCGHHICRAFKGPNSKFDNVRHLIFAEFLHVTPHQDTSDMAKELCQVFHGLRHATINMQYLFSLFPPAEWWAIQMTTIALSTTGCTSRA